MSSDSIEVPRSWFSWSFSFPYMTRSPAFGWGPVEGPVRGRNVVAEGGLEGGAEGAAVECGLRDQIPGVRRVQSGQAGRSRGVEAMGVAWPDQVLHGVECPRALTGEQDTDHVRAAKPLEEAAVVELAPPRPGGCRGAQAEDTDGVERLIEHADGLGHANEGGVVRPHTAVDQPDMLAWQGVRGEVGGRRAGGHGDLPQRHP